MMIENLKLHICSELGNIFLVLVCRENDYKRLVKKKYFEYLVNKLIDLETEHRLFDNNLHFVHQ
jgi:hypothetical protein